MDTAKLTQLAIVAGMLYAAHRFGPAPVKVGAMAIAAVIVGRQIPYVRDQLA